MGNVPSSIQDSWSSRQEPRIIRTSEIENEKANIAMTAIRIFEDLNARKDDVYAISPPASMNSAILIPQAIGSTLSSLGLATTSLIATVRLRGHLFSFTSGDDSLSYI